MSEYRPTARPGTFCPGSVLCWFRGHLVADEPSLRCAWCARPLVPRVDFLGPAWFRTRDFSSDAEALYLVVVRDHPPPIVERPCRTLVEGPGLRWVPVAPGVRVEGVPFKAAALARLVYWTRPQAEHKGLASIRCGGVVLRLRPWVQAAIHASAAEALSATTVPQLVVPMSSGPFR